ncbi:sugar transferase [Agromyces protaetiae]|uniref:Sugar transferase n=1 Tax=Agromyces protaetiae TaxID=2509455 RepID=A0A4P6FB54_9MICO|nr:sugar transferase [Agromyces protaetiae]QAY72213.1 sugar transferase [Agromyces protaetiae]
MTGQTTSFRIAGAARDTRPAPTSDWATRYRRRLIATDAAIVVGVLLVGALAFSLALDADRPVAGSVLIAAVGAIVWLVCLAAFDSRDPIVFAEGTGEYRSVASATLVAAGLLLLGAWALDLDVARPVFVTAIPVGLVVLLAGRAAWRAWLLKERGEGRMLSRVLLVGAASTTEPVANELARHPKAGYRVVGEFVPTPDASLREHLANAVDLADAEIVMVTGSDVLDPGRVRELDRTLHDLRRDVRLVFSPSVTNVSASRVRTHAAAGMPLVHVGRSPAAGPLLAAKRAVDVAGSLAIIVALLPVLVTVAVLVATTSHGPVFYAQERIGREGRTFRILKFRSMVVDADDRLAALLAEQGTAGTPLFKIERDPRLTPVGAVLRRYSLDELPQLFNVLTGDMSLIGPRPQRPAEVALYDEVAMRRLAVRPGMTGLWQVSGRSRLTWDEALALDLYYIENWSLGADVSILARTFRAVVGSDGAY